MSNSHFLAINFKRKTLFLCHLRFTIYIVKSKYFFSRTWVDEDMVDSTCGESYQCKFDYSVTLSREFAVFTKYYQDQFINIREGVLKPEARVISCGALPTPANGRKSTFAFTPGTMVKFDCDPGYVLTGERRRWCYDTGDWNWAEKGDAQCLRKLYL